MRPAADEAALVEDEDLVGKADGRCALRDQKRGGAPRQLTQRVAQRGIGGKVERGGAVIQNQNFRFPGQGAGDGEPLALAAGEIASAGLDQIVQAAVLARDDLGGLRRLERHGDRFV